MNNKEKQEINDELNKIKEIYEISKKIRENPTVVTHFGDDLDNRSSIYVLEKWAKDNGIIAEGEKLNVERVPAGKVKEGMVNVDTGGHKGSKYDGDTIIIDGDPENGVKSAIEEIKNTFGINSIPIQILECADALPTKTSIFDTRSGMSLHKFASIETVFDMASKGLLTRELTDEELEKYGLKEAQQTQQKIVDEAKEKVEKYTKVLANGKKIVISPEMIKSGSMVAYEMGIDYYSSVESKENGSTFAINAKPGVRIPEEVKEFGEELVKKYQKEDGTSGVFVHPNGQMIIAGGPKNPDFKVEMESDEVIAKINNLFDDYARNDISRELLNKARENELLKFENIEVEQKIESIENSKEIEDKRK